MATTVAAPAATTATSPTNATRRRVDAQVIAVVGSPGTMPLPGDRDVLALHELEQTVVSALATETALLDAAERRRRV